MKFPSENLRAGEQMELFPPASDPNDETPCDWDSSAPPFEIPEFAPLGLQSMAPSALGRHVLILGETGSGRTASGILPILRAAARYGADSSMAPAALVIDVKREIYPALSSGVIEPERILPFDVRNPTLALHLFEGQPMSDPRFGNREFITARLFALSRYAMAESTARDPFWIQQTRLSIAAMVGIDLEIYKKSGVVGLRIFWGRVRAAIAASLEARKREKPIHGDTYHRAWEQMQTAMDSYAAVAGLSRAHQKLRDALITTWYDVRLSTNSVIRGKQFAALLKQISEILKKQRPSGRSRTALVAARAVGTHLQRISAEIETSCLSAGDSLGGVLSYNRDNYFALHRNLLLLAAQHSQDGSENLVLAAYHEAALQQHVHPVDAGFIRNLASLARNTFTSLIAVILNILEEFTSPALTHALSLNPFEAPTRHVSVRETIEDGKWLVYSPSGASPAVETVGRALKSKFFEFTFRRRNRLRPFVYACDEFHRFVTDDPESGEQNFLDRCRAFRGICVLATQSIASISVGLSG